MDISMQLTRKLWTNKLRDQAKLKVEDQILDLLTGPVAKPVETTSSTDDSDETETTRAQPAGRDSFREMLRDGSLDGQTVDVDVPNGPSANQEVSGNSDSNHPSFVNLTEFFKSVNQNKKQSFEKKKLLISEAREVILEMELEKLLENIDLKKEAIKAVEESGIVFIDEIDKICSSREGFSSRGPDASAEGVQRDLLPLIEGTTISTKYGNVDTSYILFIASGAFHLVKPSDLLPELQGRLPIRVELKGLTEDDLYRILTEPVANLIFQQKELIATEGVTLKFDDDAIREMARMAAELNRTVENIGARRLHTVMERIMEELSFQAAEEEKGVVLKVDMKLVEDRLSDVVKSKTDTAKYIL
jgi:ATP-dependent HslUV protease ATP-binding subunit HslU